MHGFDEQVLRAPKPVGSTEIEMDILIGICGIGNGHAIRQTSVIRWLDARGHRVFILATEQSLRIMRTLFPEHAASEVFVPWVASHSHGVDFKMSACNDRNGKSAVYQENYAALARVDGFFAAKPDLVISDYEPTVAQYAYANDRPLVTFDEQSKFLGYDFPPIENSTRQEEASRLRMFFPKAGLRLSCSFFPVVHPRDSHHRVDLVSPLLRNEFTASSIPQRGVPNQNENRKRIVVYFSPYGSFGQNPQDVIEVLARFPHTQFQVFSDWCYKNVTVPDHVELFGFDFCTFPIKLQEADGLICTAGHTLLSEAFYLRKPVLAIPLDTFSQKVCAGMIEQLGLGFSHRELSFESVSRFLNRLRDLQERGEVAWNKYEGSYPSVFQRLEDECGL